MRGLEKDNMKRGHQTDRQTDTHCDSMKELAKGGCFENLILETLNLSTDADSTTNTRTDKNLQIFCCCCYFFSFFMGRAGGKGLANERPGTDHVT